MVGETSHGRVADTRAKLVILSNEWKHKRQLSLDKLLVDTAIQHHLSMSKLDGDLPLHKQGGLWKTSLRVECSARATCKISGSHQRLQSKPWRAEGPRRKTSTQSVK